MRSGVLFGVGAYGLWGVFPLYFPLLEPAGPLEILAHRIGWSLVVVGIVLALRKRLGSLREIASSPRTMRLLAGATVLIAVNWSLYIYAVTSDRVLESALGYFINPLVSVAFGMLVFKERLRPAQTAALAFGTGAVIVLTAFYGDFPWIALVLAFSFGTYGLLKKLADVGAAEGLAMETLLLLIPALTYLVVLGSGNTFTDHGTGHVALLLLSGPVTAIPLMLFSAAVTRVPLSMIGLLQYMAPVLQFLIGWAIMGEDMPLARWIGFTLVWIAVVLLTTDALRAAGANRREQAIRLPAPEPV